MSIDSNEPAGQGPVSKRIVDYWYVLGFVCVRFECGHEWIMFDPPKGWPAAPMFLGKLFGCELCTAARDARDS